MVIIICLIEHSSIFFSSSVERIVHLIFGDTYLLLSTTNKRGFDIEKVSKVCNFDH